MYHNKQNAILAKDIDLGNFGKGLTTQDHTVVMGGPENYLYSYLSTLLLCLQA
jgi:hypothetical protein